MLGPHAKGHLPTRVETDGSNFQTLSSVCPSCPAIRPAAAAFPNWPGRLVRALASLGQVTGDALVKVSARPLKEGSVSLARTETMLSETRTKEDNVPGLLAQPYYLSFFHRTKTASLKVQREEPGRRTMLGSREGQPGGR